MKQILRNLWPKEMKNSSNDHIQQLLDPSKTENRLNLDSPKNNGNQLPNNGFMTLHDLLFG